MMGGMEWGWGWMFSGGLMMLLFWGVVIVLVVLSVRGLLGNGGNSTHTAMDIPRREGRSTPLEILQARYAQGEITQDEYQQMQATLKS